MYAGETKFRSDEHVSSFKLALLSHPASLFACLMKEDQTHHLRLLFYIHNFLVLIKVLLQLNFL